VSERTLQTEIAISLALLDVNDKYVEV